MCDCEFDPYDEEYYFDKGDNESTHYLRTCEYCSNQWYGLHCLHDGYQNPCPKCDKRPTVIDELQTIKHNT